MKYFIATISIFICLTLVLGLSVDSALGMITFWVETLGRVTNEVVSAGGFPDRNLYERVPLMDTDLGAIAGEFGLINVREYIIKNMLPTWAQQQSDFGSNTFNCEVYVYPYYYIASLVTDGAGLTYKKENIYSGRMIRLDYEIRYSVSYESSFGLTKGVWSVYVFPKDDKLYFYTQYQDMKNGLLSDGYNSLIQFLEYDVHDIYHPIKSGDKGRLTGYKYIDPMYNGDSYKLESVTYSEVTFSQNADLFKKFMVGG